MSLTRVSVNNPYGVIALSLVVVALGTFAFFKTPTDLFPDTAPPQVSVITIQPGASADDVSDKITRIIEKEINTVSGLKRIRSTSRDEASVVTAEFYYTKKIGEAVTDVQSVVARVRSALPADAMEPRIYRITDATKALLTVAMSPKKGSAKSLSTIRLLADNEIMDKLLRVPGVGDVDVFGAHEPEVKIRVDRDSLAAYGLTVDRVIAALVKQNVSAPAGTVYGTTGEYLVRVRGEFGSLDEIRSLPLADSESGQELMGDVAKVSLGVHEPRSGYIGNGREAIALNVLRPEGGNTVWAIRNGKKERKKLQQSYPDINFEITNDQQPVIDTNVRGMRSSVYQAVLLTVLVILVFLADVRAAFAISLSIPLAFLSALVVLWFSPYTLNMVTLSGIIIAVGMVVDASIVVLEIIYRKHKEQPRQPIRKIAVESADDIFHGVAAGVFTTVIVLVPVMFAGGYTEQTMRPLNMMITATILSSLVAAFMVVPLVAIRTLSKPEPAAFRFVTKMLAPFTALMDRFTNGIANFAGWLIKHRPVGLLMAIPFIVLTMKIVKPINGGELMPKMDTGIGIIKFDTPTGYTPQQVKDVTVKVQKMVNDTSEGLKWISTKIGSEPGQTSFGGGGETAQSVNMTITLENRKKREASIWELENRWRAGLRKIDGVRTFEVTEYGATPLSTSKAPIDIVISGPDVHILDELADKVITRLKGVKGLTDVRRSWYIDKPERKVVVNPKLAAFYGLTPADVARLMKTAVKGVPAGTMRLQGSLDIPVAVQYRSSQVDSTDKLGDIILPTAKGPVPLRAVAKIEPVAELPYITREVLQNTIDITGIPDGLTIAQIGGQVGKRLKGIKVPRDYSIKISGTLANMKTGGGEMGRALKIGVVLLYILLVWMYKSFVHPLTIMLSILVPVAAGFWGLLLFHKPMCKPAMMGMILLAGTVVNNAILLLDFILTAREQGMSKNEAIVQAVRLRFRPIVMTAASTVLGLLPLVFEMAVGMERMSPLGIVAAFGLAIGIFSSTLIYPVIYSLFDSAATKMKGENPVKPVAAVLIGALLLGVMPANAAGASVSSSETNSIAAAGAAVSNRTITLEQAIDYALQYSPLLRAAQADAASGAGEVQSAKSALLPQLYLKGGLLYSGEDHPVIPALSPQKIRFSSTTYDIGVEIRQMLWDFGQTASRLDAARCRELASRKTAERVRDEIIFSVTSLYHQGMMSDDLMRASVASQKAMTLLVQNIEKRRELGKASLLDLHKAKARLAAVRSTIALVEARRTDIRSALMATMGYTGSSLSWKKSGNLTAASSTTVLPDEDVLFYKAVASRGDIAALKALLDAGAAAEKSARGSRWPVISAFGQYGQYGAQNPEPGNALGNWDQGWEDNYLVGVQLSLPLFDSGLRSGQIASAHARYLNIKARYDGMLLTVRRQVRTALAEIRSAEIRVRALGESAREAGMAFENEQKKYDVGKSTINNLLDAESARLYADSELSKAVHELEIARANLKLVTGKHAENSDNSAEQ
jgi:multidrug efflux pump subunit AcrB/outer membrane protein TolC